MNYLEMAAKVQQHLLSFFNAQNDDSLVYHNLDHTQSVVKAATRIANHYQLDERDYFIVITAAWFHDSGYFLDYYNHEEKGIELARTFLQSQHVDEEIISKVSQCIQATKMPQRAEQRLEEIVCDADLFHLGTDEFPEKNRLMRQEAQMKKGIRIDKATWRNGTIKLLETHHYFTDFCQLLLNDTKNENLQRLKSKVRHEKGDHKNGADTKSAKLIEPVIAVIQAPGIPEDDAEEETPDAKKDLKKNQKSARPDRGIETMFRITSNNNQRLSDMADNKAQIMITVNSIILSAVISLLLRKLEEYSYLAWPTYMILTVSVTTIIFSILATRPSVPTGVFTPNDIDQKKVNLLFFGNFYKMNLDEYSSGMQKVMSDRDFLYGTLIKDVYSQGVVLGRKYRLLRISYNIFMFGLIVSVLAFVIASAVAGK
jgi:predicted metal-dependent HD superfamily phosphohydrolase